MAALTVLRTFHARHAQATPERQRDLVHGRAAAVAHLVFDGKSRNQIVLLGAVNNYLSERKIGKRVGNLFQDISLADDERIFSLFGRAQETGLIKRPVEMQDAEIPVQRFP